MRTASARALWPFFVRFSAPSPAWIARVPQCAAGNAPDQFARCRIADVYIQCNRPARLILWRRLAQKED